MINTKKAKLVAYHMRDKMFKNKIICFLEIKVNTIYLTNFKEFNVTFYLNLVTIKRQLIF